MKRTWYEIRNADEDEAEVLLYDEIGYWGVSAQEFVKELQAITAKTITLRVNSPGGDVFDGMSIFNALKNHAARVVATVEGLAASSASFIVQAADRLVMAEGSTMMIHEPFGMTLGDASDHEKMAEVLNKIASNIAGIYSGRAGGSEEDWRERMREESWYRAWEAVDIGLADELQPAKGKPTALLAGQRIFNLSSFKNVPSWMPRPMNEAVPYADQGKAPEEETWTAPTLADFTDESWDSLSSAEKNRIARHAVWTESGMPPDKFSDLGGFHHRPQTSGVGPCVWRAVSSGRMEQASWSDDAGVRAHRGSHYRQFGRTPPWEEEEDRGQTPDGDPFAEVDWAEVLGEYARYNAPEPNLEKVLAEHPIEQSLNAGKPA